MTVERLKALIKELEEQVAFEKQRNLKSQESIMAGWNEEYHDGYIDGMIHVIASLNLELSVLEK